MKTQGKHPDIPIWSDNLLNITQMPFSQIKGLLDIIAKQNKLQVYKRRHFAKAMKILIASASYN